MKNSFLLILIAVFIIFHVSPASAATKTIITDAKAVIGPILELTVSQKGQSELKFGNIRPAAIGSVEVGPVIMLIEVKANTGERYQVTQGMTGPLVDEEGHLLSLENLKFTSSALNTNGTAVTSPITASSSPQVIFTSDMMGSSDTISVNYNLTVPPTQQPGDYSSNLTYTVSSL